MRDISPKPVDTFSKAVDVKPSHTQSVSTTHVFSTYDPTRKYETIEDYYELYKVPYVTNLPDLPPGVPRIQSHDSGFSFPNEASKKIADQNLSYSFDEDFSVYHVRELHGDPRVSSEFKENFFKKNPHLDPKKNKF